MSHTPRCAIARSAGQLVTLVTPRLSYSAQLLSLVTRYSIAPRDGAAAERYPPPLGAQIICQLVKRKIHVFLFTRSADRKPRELLN